MRKVNEIYEFLCALAPLELQLAFDNSGFQLGRRGMELSGALLALDVTDEVVDEAIAAGVHLIISHHPLIFTPLKSITDTKLIRLIQNDIAVISMHTNLDIAQGGVNDVLLGLFDARPDGVLDADGCGRIGTLCRQEDFPSFLERCKRLLHTKGLRCYSAGRPVRRLAVMGGSGGSCVRLAFEKGCDTYLTADVKYDQFLTAKELGINLIDGDHFCTENPVIPALKARLETAFPDVRFSVSQKHAQVISFF